jgi:hypothetical protein
MSYTDGDGEMTKGKGAASETERVDGATGVEPVYTSAREGSATVQRAPVKYRTITRKITRALVMAASETERVVARLRDTARRPPQRPSALTRACATQQEACQEDDKVAVTQQEACQEDDKVAVRMTR